MKIPLLKDARVFISATFYALDKYAAQHGFNPEAELRQWPGARTMATVGAWVPRVNTVTLIDSSTNIAKARSRAAFAFSQGDAADCDLWLSVDDDAEIDADAMRILLSATLDDAPRLVMVPQWVSGGERVNVGAKTPLTITRMCYEHALAPCDFCGCSIMCVNRPAIELLRRSRPDLLCATQGLFALFVEQVVASIYQGEDVAFCERARHAGLVPEILLDVASEHAGKKLDSRWYKSLV